MAAWKAWGEKPKELEEECEFPPHFEPAVRAFNTLKRVREIGEAGPQPIPISEIHLYITQVLGYSDPYYIEWTISVILGCDQGEREIMQERLKQKRDEIMGSGPKNRTKR